MTTRNGLILGSLLSVLLMVIFGTLQYNGSTILSLPPQWILIALLPIVVMLFVGGYVTRFKGFGIELESTLTAPVTSIDLTASDLVADIPGDQKKSIGYLHSLSKDKARSLRWLLFTSGRQGYYNASAVAEYLMELPNLEFFEVRTHSGGILGFLPIASVRASNGEPDLEKLEAFIRAIENGDLRAVFPSEAITLQVRSDESLVRVLSKMRSERAAYAAVLSRERRYLGVVLSTDLERRIADSVMLATRIDRRL